VKIFVYALFAAALLTAQTPGLTPIGGAITAKLSNPAANLTQDVPTLRTAFLDDSEVRVTVSKSIILEHPEGIRRISISNGEIAEAVAVSSTEILLNGKSVGDTTLILWDPKGNRRAYDVHSLPNSVSVDAVRGELVKEFGPSVSLTLEGDYVFLRGTVDDSIMVDRAVKIAGTAGKVINLLRVSVPPGDPQILLKVRFATVSRSAASQLGMNIFSTSQKGISNVTTGQFGQNPTLQTGSSGTSMSFSDLLNIFYFRPDLNLGTFIQALEAKSLVQVLAEPNLLTTSGREASFLAGGEFPFPTIQGGAAGVGQITVQFKEFGIRLQFLPVVTPRGTIRLVVTPEVSSLDYSNGLTVNGFTVPGLSTRRVQTEIELENGQSFVIAGLLNNQVTEQFNKVPGIGDIPVLGKLFQSRSLTKNDDELMVLVTPELVAPIPAGVKPPEVKMPLPFMKGAPTSAPMNPRAPVTGPLPKTDSLPFEVMKSLEQTSGGSQILTPDTGSQKTAAPPVQAAQQNSPPSAQPSTGSTNH
jgi:pilus assembly protein CpaC